MIWSVSTSLRRSGTTVPVWTVKASISLLSSDQICRWCARTKIAGGGEVTGHRGRGGDARRHEVGPAAGALPALEVAVGGAGAPLPRRQRVRVHPEAHRAARATPLGPGRGEDLIEAFLLRLLLDQHRAGHHEHPDAVGDRASADDLGGGP